MASPLASAPDASAAASEPSAGRLRAWLFVTRELFRRASGLVGADFETAWSRLWLDGVELGHAWGPTEGLPDGEARLSLETEVLRPEFLGSDVSPGSSAVERALGSRPTGLLLCVEGRSEPGSVALLVTRRMLADASNFRAADLETVWTRLWVLAVDRQAYVADAPEATIRVVVHRR